MKVGLERVEEQQPADERLADAERSLIASFACSEPMMPGSTPSTPPSAQDGASSGGGGSGRGSGSTGPRAA